MTDILLDTHFSLWFIWDSDPMAAAVKALGMT